ncbi:MAG: hypothetical protein WCO84_09135, partial [bacterium]
PATLTNRGVRDDSKCYAHLYRDKYDTLFMDMVTNWNHRWMTEDCHRHRVDWRERALEAERKLQKGVRNEMLVR